MKRHVSIALALGLMAAFACAKAWATPTPVPDVKPDLSAMAMFMGTWNCTSTKSPDGRTNGHVFTTTTVMALDGRWMQTDQRTPPFDQYRTRNFVLRSYETYDPGTKLWTTLTVDNLGAYVFATSPGWNGDTLVTTEKITSGGGTPGVDTITKLTDMHYHDRYQIDSPKGLLTWESDCVKST